MKVFKFGGASLKNARGVRQVASIVQNQTHHHLLVVVSAMGKTTDTLEYLLTLKDSKARKSAALQSLKEAHQQVIHELFSEPTVILEEIGRIFDEIEVILEKDQEPDLQYDQVVSKGELISSLVLFHYLTFNHCPTAWIDARAYISTDRTFREANVDWGKTSSRIQSLRAQLDQCVVITQGFIGMAEDGLTTTLGREGSDFSAAIFGASLQAESVTIWKDVPGVMSADPRRFPDAKVFEELPFKEAAEMTYYGASVIHPKTIKPLANKGIKLLVKSFDNPTLPGTQIHECIIKDLPPLIVFKENQVLISCKATDYTFISEQQLSTIFTTLLELNVRINVMQNSAISFSFCIDFRESKVTKLIEKLQQSFEVNYNTGLTLITVKNYDHVTSEHYRQMAGVLLEQSSRSTLQVLVKKT